MSIFDTDVVVDFLRGMRGAKEEFNTAPSSERFVTIITVMETYVGAKSRSELLRFQKFFQTSFQAILPVSETVSFYALSLLENFSFSHGLRLPDALIAAIAIESQCTLITGNAKHFSYLPGIKVSLPKYRRQLHYRPQDESSTGR